jgi:uncharacterized membrane protein (DUF2068 family)
MTKKPTQRKRRRKSPRGLRVIAAVKLFKGVLLLGIGLGLFALVNSDLDEIAQKLTDKLNIDPENHYARVFLEKAADIQPDTLRHFGLWSLVYSAILLTEGTGLWLNLRWAKYMVIVSTGAFIPEEVYMCLYKFNGFKLGVLVLNIAILAYIILLVVRREKAEA